MNTNLVSRGFVDGAIPMALDKRVEMNSFSVRVWCNAEVQNYVDKRECRSKQVLVRSRLTSEVFLPTRGTCRLTSSKVKMRL